MRKLFTLLALLCALNLLAQQKANYQLAARFSPKKLEKLKAAIQKDVDSQKGDDGKTKSFERAKDTAGKAVGEVLGWMVTVDIVDGDSVNAVHITDRIGTMVLKFDDENKIIAAGGTSYQKGEQVMKLGIEQKRAVVGGTGKYANAGPRKCNLKTLVRISDTQKLHECVAIK